MDFSDIDKFEENDDPSERKHRGCFTSLFRFFLISAAVIAAVLTLVAWFLTTDLGRLWLLNKINHSIAPAHLRISEWQAGILHPVELSGVEFDSPEQGVHVECRQILFSKGVLGLLPVGRLSLGAVNLIDPVVIMDRVSADERKPAPAASDSNGGFFMPIADVSGKIYLENGTVVVKEREGQKFIADQLEGELLVDSFWQPFGFKISGRAGNGKVDLTGDLQSIYKLLNGVDSEYEDKLVLQLEKVDLSAFSPLLKMVGGRDVLHAGIAEGALTFKRTGLTGVDIEGGMLVDGLQLVTGKDKYSPAGNSALMIDAQVEDNRWIFKRFDFSSPWITAKLHGSLQRVNDNRLVAGEINADVDADLAAIARDFRYALAIDKEFKVEQGSLKGAFELSGSSDNIRVESNLKTSQIKMLYKGRSVALNRNPSLSFKVVFPRDKMPELEELKFDSSFANIYGKGTIERGVIKGYLDLTQFSTDFKGLLSSDITFAGATHFDFSTRPSGKDVAFDLMTKFSKLKYSSKGKGSTSIESGSLSCGGSVVGASRASSFKDLDFNEVDFDLRLMDSRAHGQLKRYVPAKRSEVVPVLRGCTLNCNINMSDVVNALGALMTKSEFKDAASWKGSLLSNMAIESANGIAKVRFNGSGTDIGFTVAKKKMTEPNLQFSGAVTYDSNKDSLVVNQGVLSSELAQVHIPEWTVDFVNKGDDIRFNGKADAEVDIALLYPLLSNSATPGYDQVSGNLALKLDAQSTSSGTELGVNGTLSDFYTLIDNEISFFERKAQLTGDFLIADDGGHVKIQTLKLYSGLVDVFVDGRVDNIGKGAQADLQGDMEFNFDTLGKLLKVRGIDEWNMTGHKKHPFSLKGPVTEGLSGFLQKGKFSGAGYMASLNGLGLSAGGADVTFDLAHSRLKCRWQPLLNGGQLNLQPVFDYGPRGTVLSLPDDIQLLKDVKITQQVVDNLLVHLNPMFHGSEVHKGSVDLKVKSFRSDVVNNKNNLFFDADIAFNDLDMTLSPSMRQLLSMIKVSNSRYQVKKLLMHVVIRDERVHIDPVTMVFSNQPVSFSGSVGFDSTIKYLIEIPLSDAIAAKTGLKISKGLTVKVPVTGTVDNPRLDTSALENAVGDFLKKTIGEEAMRGVGDFLQQLTEELRK
ncbi:MAG: hypothetical protein PF904_20605 [Kiritimatiellae bacterium]|jgi:hypothetical protein|nr:hypothetical protein [Kiritimatiellia bacterium]